MYKRVQFQEIKNRIIEPRRFMQVILGPRQVGKTTLIKQLIQEIDIPNIYLSLDGVASPSETWLEQQWETARLMIKQKGYKDFFIVIDEVQKMKDWSEYIKTQWDKDTFAEYPIKLILLGSSSLLIQKGLSESLTGRFEVIYLTHWSFKEMHDAFNITHEEYVWYGGYPGSISLINNFERWKNYINDAIAEPSILRDVLMLSRIDKPALMKQLFELACTYSGQVLSLNKILGQLQDSGNTTTLAHYLSLLDSAGLVCGLNKFYKEKIHQKSSIPKFLVYNTAFMTIGNNLKLDEVLLKPEKWGRHVETAVGAHLLNSSIKNRYKVYYWRDSNDEVDFVIQKGEKVIGLEIKSGKSGNAHGMEAFARTFQPYKVLMVGMEGISWQDFLEIDPFELF